MQNILKHNENKRAFVDGNLVIDCSDIYLVQNTTTSPLEFRGSGFMHIDPRKGVEARFISAAGAALPYNPFEKMLRQQGIKSGQIYPDSHYFRLSATDVYGSVWLNPSVEVDYDYHGTSVVVIIKCGWIRTILPAQGVKDYIHMLFLDKAPFPMNVMEKNALTRDGKESVSLNYKRSGGSAGGAIFSYVSVDDMSPYYELYAKPAVGDHLPLNFEYRIIEAIRYTSATSMSYAICERVCNEIRSIEISSTPQLNTGIFPRALIERRDWDEDFFNLLDCYLSYSIANAKDEEFSFLSQTIGGLYQLKGVSLDSIALLVSVAIESIVQHEFNELGKATEITLTDLNTVDKSLENLPINANTLARIKGKLGGMKSSSAADKLHELKVLGVINDAEVKGWKKLRNATAHGSLHIPSGEIQKLLDSVYKATGLINKLVFQAIGYRGRYIDYSTPGWPEANFSTPSKVACSAKQPVEVIPITKHRGLLFRILASITQNISRLIGLLNRLQLRDR